MPQKFMLLILLGMFSLGATAQDAPVAGFGSSLQFDGSNDYAEINPYTSPTGDFTIEFWVKPVDLNGGWRGFFGRQPGAANTRGPSMWQNGDLWHCDSYKSDGTRFSVGINDVFKQPGEWVHLAWVKSGGTYYYYRNGKQIHTANAPPNADYVTNTELWFGRVDNYYNAFFDEVRIWTIARTRAQINEFRFRNLPQPLPANLLHYYPLDEGSGAVINDIGAAGQNGQLVNGPAFRSAASSPPITTPEETPVSSFVKGSDANGDVLTFEKASDPAKGSVVFTPSTGAYTYTPNANATGSDSFTYQIRDDEIPSKVSQPATVNVSITPVNDAPVAQGDHYHIAEDGTLSVAAPGVLHNDSDVDGDHIFLDIGTQPSMGVKNGNLVLNQDGSFTYMPNANFNGNDNFRYLVTDGFAVSSSAVDVTIRVDAINDPPVAVGNTYSVAEDGTLTVDVAQGVLRNDVDPDGNTLTVRLQSDVASGTLGLASDGSFAYTPSADFNGLDTFVYVASDGIADSAPTSVSINVRPTNDIPSPQPDQYTTAEDALLVISSTSGVLANDNDRDGDILKVETQDQAYAYTRPANGTLKNFESGGGFSYKPDPDFSGTDSFTYFVSDGQAVSGPVLVNIAITPSNDAPVANDDTFSVPEDGFLHIGPGFSAGTILDNDKDADGNPLSVTLVSGPSNGGLQLGTQGGFEYRPDANFDGIDVFTYKASDGLVNSNTATVSIVVNAVNDVPVAQPESYSVAQNGLLSVDVSNGLLGNDTDADGDTLISLLETPPQFGALQFTLAGSFTYKHDGSNNFSDSFTYRASDRTADSAVVTVNLTINPVNRAPLGAFDTYTGIQETVLDVPATAGVLINDLDLDGDTLIAAPLTYPRDGALGFRPDGSFSYTPARGFSGTDTFTYQAIDGIANSSPVTVTLIVNAVNTPPLGGADKYNASSGQVLQISAGRGLLSNDVDVDGQLLSVTRIAAQPAKGVLQSNPDGSFKYYPFPTFTGGTDTFSYFVSDGKDQAGPITVSLNYLLTPNQPPVANDDRYSVPQGSLLTVTTTNGLLTNDTDGDGNTLLTLIEALPAYGQLKAGLDGSFTYLHDGSNNFTDTFTYRANDGSSDSNLATVAIAIGAVNRPPLSGPDTYSLTQDNAIQIPSAAGVLVNDIDPDGDSLQAIIQTYPSNGALGLDSDGGFSYQPARSFSGLDSFSYRAWDGKEQSATATVTLAVSAINTPPLGGDDNYRAISGQVLQINASNGVLANDIDLDQNTLHVTQVGVSPSRGTLKLETDGAFVYTPNSTFVGGIDSFTYFLSDGSIEVGPVNVTLDYVATPTPLYAVGGQVAGLVNTNSITLTLNGSEDRTLTRDGTFSFTPIPNGTAYSVAITQQPAGQSCAVVNGSGTLTGGAATNVSVSCAKNDYSIGGQISGLAGGATVALQNNGGDDLLLAVNGRFTFASAQQFLSSYVVTVLTQPSAPSETCTVTTGSGIVSSANVNSVNVTCSVNKFAVSGSVSGLALGQQVVLTNNDANSVTLQSDGSFQFPSKADGAAYAVGVATQPTGQTCVVTNGSGVLAGSDVGNVSVACLDDPLTLGGAVSGLAAGTSVILQNNGGDNLSLPINGPFTFPSTLTFRQGYDVKVLTQPDAPSETCQVTQGSGNMPAMNVTSVSVTCSVNPYAISGVISGLTGGEALKLRLNGADEQLLNRDGAFAFSPIADGSAFVVTIASQPEGQTCTVNNGSGTLTGTAVTNVLVSCARNSYKIGGQISGLDAGASAVLQNNGGDDLSLNGNGPFSFTTSVPYQDAYKVTVKTQPSAPSETCTVANGADQTPANDVTSVSVVCATNSFSVGGAISGLTPGRTLTLQNNGADLRIYAADGNFIFAPLADSSSYDITVALQPSDQFCSVQNGSGMLAGSDVGSVTVSCSVLNRTFSGTLPSGGVGTLSFTTADPTCEFSGAPTFLPAASQSGAPAGLAVYDGLVSFEVQSCSPGATVDMSLDYGRGLPQDGGYWKVDTPWRQMNVVIAGTVVTFSITDGGQFDNDGVINGAIVDPSGLVTRSIANPAEPRQIPATPWWALILLTMLVLALAFWAAQMRLLPGAVAKRGN